MNYREFLKDYYDHSKKMNANFSHRSFALKAGFLSSNFLYLIINGKRNLTKDFIPKFASAIGLNKREQQYFDALVSFNQAKNNDAKRYYLEILSTFKKDKTGKLLNDVQYKYISTWYYPVIRELVSLPHFKESPTWIKQQLGGMVSGKQAKESIEMLISLGLLQRDKNGKLFQVDAHVITNDEVTHAAAYTFHQQMLSLAKHILASTNGDGREISGITMAISGKQFHELKRRIHEFEDTILKYLTDNPDIPEDIYQVNVQFFPITNVKKGKVSHE